MLLQALMLIFSLAIQSHRTVQSLTNQKSNTCNAGVICLQAVAHLHPAGLFHNAAFPIFQPGQERFVLRDPISDRHLHLYLQSHLHLHCTHLADAVTLERVMMSEHMGDPVSGS